MGAGGMVSNIVGQVGGLVGSTLSAFDSMNKYGGYEKVSCKDRRSERKSENISRTYVADNARRGEKEQLLSY